MDEDNFYCTRCGFDDCHCPPSLSDLLANAEREVEAAIAEEPQGAAARELALVRTNLQQAGMWLGKAKEKLSAQHS